MAHHIYTTDAFILESFAGREADKTYALFTEELGLIRASAKGVRLQKSKLRYSLQDLSFSAISLVRGREFWRITNAHQKDDLFGRYKHDHSTVYSIARVFRMLSRLIPEEEKNSELFNDLTDAFNFLEQFSSTSPLGKQEILFFEYIIALRILERLGYLQHIAELRPFVTDPLTIELIQSFAPHKKRALEAINTSIRNSHL